MVNFFFKKLDFDGIVYLKVPLSLCHVKDLCCWLVYFDCSDSCQYSGRIFSMENLVRLVARHGKRGHGILSNTWGHGLFVAVCIVSIDIGSSCILSFKMVFLVEEQLYD